MSLKQKLSLKFLINNVACDKALNTLKLGYLVIQLLQQNHHQKSLASENLHVIYKIQLKYIRLCIKLY